MCLIKYLNKLRLKHNHVNRLAFTLAEIIIVLGVLGFVSATTVPTLVNNANQQNYNSNYRLD